VTRTCAAKACQGVKLLAKTKAVNIFTGNFCLPDKEATYYI